MFLSVSKLNTDTKSRNVDLSFVDDSLNSIPSYINSCFNSVREKKAAYHSIKVQRNKTKPLHDIDMTNQSSDPYL